MMTSKPLKNARHEKFVLNLVKGMTQTQAAIEAGYKSSRARITGANLATKSNIIARREALQFLDKKDTVMTVTERKERLSFLAQEANPGKFGYQRQPNITAIAELNKMGGDYAPEKHLNLNVDVKFVIGRGYVITKGGENALQDNKE